MTEPSGQTPAESARLEWRGECCIEALAAQHEQLLGVLDEGLPVELDLSGVSRIDTAGLQLLLAFVLEMRRRDRKLTLSGPSDAVLTGAKLAGIGTLLGV